MDAAPRRTKRWPRKGRGFVLPATLVTLLLLLLLSTAVARLAAGDFRRSRDTRHTIAAREAADLAAHLILRDWESIGAETLAVGATTGTLPLALGSGARASSRVVRATDHLFWSVGLGEDGDSLAGTLARRGAHLAVRLAIPDVPLSAALTVRDSVTLAGAALVVGSDSTPMGWTGCAAPAPAAAVALPDTTRICDGGCGPGRAGGRVAGTPPLLADSAAALPSRYAAFGAESWQSLVAHAGLVLAPGAVVTPAPSVLGGRCDRALSSNWGDPTAPGSACGAYFPLVWARGDVEIRGGIGQGVLLAEGDVTLSAGALFAGLVIAKDDLLAVGTGGTIVGAAMAADVRPGTSDHTHLEGGARIQWSRCAVDRALQRSARPVPVRGRPWAAVY